MDIKNIFSKIAKDIEVDLSDEFDKNFERKAFFDKKWPQTKHQYSRGSLMMRSGKGRASIKSSMQGGRIRWFSPLPYMALHNEGGEITVTEAMKKYFWAMHYKTSNAIETKADGKTPRNNQRNQALGEEALKWKYMALQKVGSKMIIDQRQIIGDHPVVRDRIRWNFNNNLKHVETFINSKLKK